MTFWVGFALSLTLQMPLQGEAVAVESDADNAVLLIGASLRSIHSAEAEISWTTTRRPTEPKTIIGHEVHWGYENGKEFMRGIDRNFRPSSGKVTENKIVRAFDGNRVRTFDYESYSGVLREKGLMEFREHRTPLTFLGLELLDSMVGWKGDVRPTRDLIAVCEGARLISDSEDTMLFRSKLFARENIPDYCYVEVALSKPHGLAIKRVDVRGSKDELFASFIIKDFCETDTGVWFPLLMEEYLYTVEFAYPDDVKRKLGDPATSREERLRLFDERIPVENGISPYRPLIIKVDPKTLKVNHDVDDDLFTFEFPPGSNYVDELHPNGPRRVVIPGSRSSIIE